ncbi:hypothetical protein AB0P10_21980 [Streptomyces parvus]|uniref:hypothetical protein n=1 Tax=Streptomyces parvus TaxID=66428 RepID=UPI0034418092
MAWEEWERSKEAVAEGHTPMRLNEAGSQVPLPRTWWCTRTTWGLWDTKRSFSTGN